MWRRLISTKPLPTKLLFTHRGLSGPAILQISNYWQPGESIHLDLLPYNDIRHHFKRTSPIFTEITVKNRIKPFIT